MNGNPVIRVNSRPLAIRLFILEQAGDIGSIAVKR